MLHVPICMHLPQQVARRAQPGVPVHPLILSGNLSLYLSL